MQTARKHGLARLFVRPWYKCVLEKFSFFSRRYALYHPFHSVKICHVLKEQLHFVRWRFLGRVGLQTSPADPVRLERPFRLPVMLLTSNGHGMWLLLWRPKTNKPNVKRANWTYQTVHFTVVLMGLKNKSKKSYHYEVRMNSPSSRIPSLSSNSAIASAISFVASPRSVSRSGKPW